MNNKKLYISLSIVISILIVALLGWGIFISIKQNKLQKNTTDIGYFNTPSAKRETQGSFFSKIANSIKKNILKKSDVHIIPRTVAQQLSNRAIAGYEGSGKEISFVDRATGHIFKVNTATTTTRIDQTTIPQLYKALFVQNGNGIIRQFITNQKNIESMYSDISGGTATTTALSRGMIDIVTNTTYTKIAYLSYTPSGSVLTVSNPNGTDKKILFRSLLRGWNIDWQQGNILMTQNASGRVPGSAYLVNATTGASILALQQLPGLTTVLSPDGTKILYSTIQKNGFPSLSIYNIQTQQKTNLGNYGLAKKCVWSTQNTDVIICGLSASYPKGLYPDDWYQGVIHFKDDLWSINIKDYTLTKIIKLSQRKGVPIDISSISMNDTGSIFFINKTDYTLWKISIPSTSATTTITDINIKQPKQ